MTPIHDAEIVHPSVWKGADILSKDAVAADLDVQDLAEIQRTLEAIGPGKPATTVRANDVHMPRVDQIRCNITHR